MESENGASRLNIDLNVVINDVVSSIGDVESNDVTVNIGELPFDLNEDVEINSIDTEEVDVEANINNNGHDSQNGDVEIDIIGNEEDDVGVNDHRNGHDSENEDDEFNTIDNEEVADVVNNIRNGHDFQNGSNGEEQQSRTPAVGMYFASGEEFTRFLPYVCL